MDFLTIVMRVLHIGSAIGLLGGMAFALIAMLPAMRLLDDDLRQKLLHTAQRRFYRIAHPAAVLLLLTGLYNYWAGIQSGVYQAAGAQVHMILGVKIILALAVFIILFAQAFRVLRGNPARWAAAAVTLGVIIIVLAAVARQMRLDAIATGG